MAGKPKPRPTIAGPVASPPDPLPLKDATIPPKQGGPPAAGVFGDTKPSTAYTGASILDDPKQLALVATMFHAGASTAAIARAANVDKKTAAAAIAALEASGQLPDFKERTKRLVRGVVSSSLASLLDDVYEASPKDRTVAVGILLDKLAVMDGEPTSIQVVRHEISPPSLVLDVSAEVNSSAETTVAAGAYDQDVSVLLPADADSAVDPSAGGGGRGFDFAKLRR